MTTIKALERLSPEEQAFMIKVPALIAVLIGGADDDFDEKERALAEKLTRYKAHTHHDEQMLVPYFTAVHEHFETQLDNLMHHYPASASLRNPMIAKELESLNSILPKLNRDFAIAFYRSMRSMARRVAESSGGVLGFFAVGKEEHKWMELDMISDPSAE